MKGNIQQTMKHVCEHAGMKRITCHALRHTYAILLLKRKKHQKAVQQRLGHAKTETTINIYSYVQLAKSTRRLCTTFSDLFGK